MHFIVFGVGAIGGFYGASMLDYIKQNPEHKLSFVARGKTLDILQNQGLKLTCIKENFGKMEENTIIANDLKVYDKVYNADIDPKELTVILLCSKSGGTLEAAQDIKKILNDNIRVISVQNGVENEDLLVKELGEKAVIAALTTVAAETLEPGIYLQKGNYGLFLGEYKPQKAGEVLQEIHKTFREAGIKAHLKDDMKQALWSKLVWNASFNPLSVFLEATVGPIMNTPEHLARIRAIMNEVVAVAKAQDINLKEDIVDDHINRTSEPEWIDFRTSMLQDFQKGKELEIEELLGVVVRKGKEFEIKTPEAALLYEDLKKKLSL